MNLFFNKLDYFCHYFDSDPELLSQHVVFLLFYYNTISRLT